MALIIRAVIDLLFVDCNAVVVAVVVAYADSDTPDIAIRTMLTSRKRFLPNYIQSCTELKYRAHF